MHNSSIFRTKYRRLLIEECKFVINFLNAHNLRWFAFGGTCIGAVRDHGIIPWDDDIDLCMPKEDYDKFLLMKDELETDHYKILSLSDKGFYCAHSKVIDTRTTLWEVKELPYIIGVFIDIFPIYQTTKTGERLLESMINYKELCLSYIRTLKRISFRDCVKSFFSKKSRVWLEFIKNKISYPPSKKYYYYTKIKQLEEELDERMGEVAICYPSFKYGEKEILKVEWFADYLEKKFEDFTIRVPVGYDGYLSKVFGDYMTPPPPEQRVLEHRDMQYYINLDERLNLSEVKKRIKSGEKIVG